VLALRTICIEQSGGGDRDKGRGGEKESSTEHERPLKKREEVEHQRHGETSAERRWELGGVLGSETRQDNLDKTRPERPLNFLRAQAGG
jgi:hypothetical protein